MSEEKTIEELVMDGVLNPTQVARLFSDKNFNPNHRYTPEQLSGFLSDISDVVTAGDENEKINSDVNVENEGLLFVYDPKNHVNYVTVIENGKPNFSLSPTGELDQSKVIPSLNPLIKVLASSGATDESEARVLYRGSCEKDKAANNDGNDEIENNDNDKKKKKKKRKPRKKKPGFIVDELAVDWFINNRKSIISEYLNPESKPGKQTELKGEAAVASLGLKRVEELNRKGMVAYFQPWGGFIKKNKGSIRTQRTIYISKVSMDDRFSSIVSDFYDKFELLPRDENGVPNVLGMFVKPSLEDKVKNVESPQQLITYSEGRNHSISKSIYKWFEKEISDKGLDVKIQMAVEVLRNDIRSNKFMRKMDKSIQRRVRECSAIWVMYASAGEEMANNSYLKEDVLPELEDPDRRSVDKQFDVACHLAKRTMDPSINYSFTKYRFHLRGLWLQGKLVKEEEEELTGKGFEVTYITPVSHVIQRDSRYTPILIDSFRNLLEDGRISGEDLKLEKSEDCAKLGARLYFNLREAERSKFTWLKNDTILSSKERNYYVFNVLKFWAGMNRDGLKQVAADYNASKSVKVE